MTPHQVGVNTRVVTEEADRLAAQGYTGDAVQFVESLLLRAFSGGWRPIEKPVPDRPERVASDEVRRAALAAARAAVDEKRRNLAGKGEG